MDFVPADHRMKIKEDEKLDKYQDVARERKKSMEHESDSDTNRWWNTWNCLQEPWKEARWNSGRIKTIQTTALLKSTWIFEEFWKFNVAWKLNFLFFFIYLSIYLSIYVSLWFWQSTCINSFICSPSFHH